MATSVAEQLLQLNRARSLVLRDSGFYPQIIHGILPITGPSARLELRRWGADFLAETFASPTLPLPEKEKLGLAVLETLRSIIESNGEDVNVLKSVVQAAANIYPILFKYIIQNPSQTAPWENMSIIKSRILRLWDTAASGVRVCCIKFVQRVIQVQTPSVVTESKKFLQNDISLSLVPKDHPLIPPRNLEAEASGLLDRLLNVFHENTSDALLVSATLNCVGVLIHTRPAIANKIIAAILNFNPLKAANSPMTPTNKIMIKSMERTTRALLININKRNPNGPLSSRILQYVERLMQTRQDIFNEGSRKRGAPGEVTDIDAAKRKRVGAGILPASPLVIPPLPPGPTSIAQLFTVTTDQALRSFDVQQLPLDMIVKLVFPVIHQLDKGLLDATLDAIRSRYLSLSNRQVPVPALEANDDDDDYEPDFEPMMDHEPTPMSPPSLSQISSKSEDVSLGPFQIGQPLPLSRQECEAIGKVTVERIFRMMQSFGEPSITKKSIAGINRLAASNYDRDAWITLIIRLATRGSIGLDTSGDFIKAEGGSGNRNAQSSHSLENAIREALYLYIMEDFRRRSDVAVSWLCEEWYNDQLQKQMNTAPSLRYEKLALRILDGFLPYLDSRDKVFLRFLSEIPCITKEILERVKQLCRDPEKVGLAVASLQYLIMFRPPAKEMCLDVLEDIWLNNEDARLAAGKLLKKWRPLSSFDNSIAEVKGESNFPLHSPTAIGVGP
ncbi:MAG: hypothetical protein M1829_002398 [Trizodia sp. TS-e1964]|nr:MAG: hypothetical protein M1829_002398 [Trizodia sp. TS-e1964]